MELFEPWPVGYKVNRRSPYGPRVHPITGKRTFHHGVDVALPVGTPLTAPADGVVVHKNRTSSAGFNLILRHEGTWHTVYYHLQKPSHLAVGDKVKAGDKIALSGNTGASTGPHLHWELRRSRTWGDTVNVMDYVVGPYVEYEPELVPEPVMPKPEPVAPTPRLEPVKPKPRPEPVKPTPRPPLTGAGHAYNHSASAARVGILQSFLNKWKGGR
jgi:murein DD-endopeptidase MepM/ murein hydrolase activator NlpD